MKKNFYYFNTCIKPMAWGASLALLGFMVFVYCPELFAARITDEGLRAVMDSAENGLGGFAKVGLGGSALLSIIYGIWNSDWKPILLCGVGIAGYGIYKNYLGGAAFTLLI